MGLCLTKNLSFHFFIIIFLNIFIYLTERDTAREGAQAGGVGEEEGNGSLGG